MSHLLQKLSLGPALCGLCTGLGPGALEGLPIKAIGLLRGNTHLPTEPETQGPFITRWRQRRPLGLLFLPLSSWGRWMPMVPGWGSAPGPGGG